MTPDPLIAALRARRVELGLTQADLARRLHVQHQQRIATLEAHHGTPTLATLRRWARALGLDLYLAPARDPRGRPRLGPGAVAQCGTISGAKRHYTRDEPLDEACRAAQRLYDRNRKRAQRRAVTP